MSTWLEFDRALIPRKNGKLIKERTQCKIGRHSILVGDRAVWLKDPMGLSCLPCARTVDPEAVQVEEERLKTPKVRQVRTVVPKVRTAKPAVPKVRTPKVREVKHGTKWTYDHHKCRCTPCREFVSRSRWERKQRARAKLAEVQA